MLFRQAVEGASEFRSQETAFAGKVPLCFLPAFAGSVSNSKHWRALPNPSLKPSPNGVSRRAASARPSAYFSLAARDAHTVGAGLAQTLGSASQRIRSGTQPESKTVMTQAAVRRIVLFRQAVEGASEFRSQETAFAGKVPLCFLPAFAGSVSDSKHQRALPNPSLKPSPNGVSRRSSSARPSAYPALAARHATPSVPA